MAKGRKKKSTSETRLHKTIFEARFKPNIEFYARLFKVASKFDGYPHWISDRLRITLYDPQKRCSLHIGHMKFSYEQDLDVNPDRQHDLSEAIRVLPPEINIDKFTRIGFRQKLLTPSSFSFEELNAILTTKILSQEKQLKTIFPSNITDHSLRVMAKKNNISFGITVGPINTKEMERWLEFNRDYHVDPDNRERDYLSIIDSYPSVAVFFDIDVYREDDDIQIKEALPFIKEAQNKIDLMVSQLIDYFFSTKIGD